VHGETIFALSSGRPPAAVAIIRISGPDAHAAGVSLAGTLPSPRQAAVRALRHPEMGDVLDEALVLRFDAPRSATGEDSVELHCHGGRAVVDSLLQALAGIPGLRAAAPGEFTRRAFDNGRIDLTEAEGLADLIEAETEMQRKAALALADGGLRRTIEEWQAQLIALSARAEQAIDYADEEDATAGKRLSSDCAAIASTLEAWLVRPRVEPLKDGVRTVVCGPPNAGKSSLINVLSGLDRAIVSDVPGTTRDHIDIPLAVGGIPIVLTDTAGLRAGGDAVEAIGIARAEALVGSADILVWLGEFGGEPPHPRLIRVHAKADLPQRQAVPDGWLPVSALTGQGVAELLERIGALAKTILPGEDAIALNRRQSECLQEAVDALRVAAGAADLAIVADGVRLARTAFDRLTGRAGVEDMLDALFSRFCLGK
jgi:tRNA modification GTPase